MGKTSRHDLAEWDSDDTKKRKLGSVETSLWDPQQDSRRLARRGLKIQRTPVGKGVFATKRFDRAEWIGEIEGTVLPSNVFEGSFYAFDLENGTFLEPASPFRFVNHSCAPNCHIDFLDQPKSISNQLTIRRLILLARREIFTGEQLTIDYAWHWSHAIPCRCKSDDCRRWIVAKSQLEQCLQSKSDAQSTVE